MSVVIQTLIKSKGKNLNSHVERALVVWPPQLAQVLPQQTLGKIVCRLVGFTV